MQKAKVSKWRKPGYPHRKNMVFIADDQAVEVSEQLAVNPDCDLRWLRTLEMIYVLRQEWGKLKFLAVRLEQQNK